MTRIIVRCTVFPGRTWRAADIGRGEKRHNSVLVSPPPDCDEPTRLSMSIFSGTGLGEAENDSKSSSTPALAPASQPVEVKATNDIEARRKKNETSSW